MLYTLILGLLSSVYYNFAIDSALSCYQMKLAQIIFVIFKFLKYKRLAQIIAIPQALTSSLYREDLVYPGKASETHTLTVNRYRETIMSIKIIRLFGLQQLKCCLTQELRQHSGQPYEGGGTEG